MTAWYSFGEYLRRRFGCRVFRVSLDAGFTCPNRDGALGTNGCSYCANESFSPEARRAGRPIREQMREGMAAMRRRYKAEKFIAYFQAFTNTYADVGTLKARYDEALDFDDVVALAIGTRPDCVSNEILGLIETYTSRVEVWIEYGLQSIHDRTLKRIHRGHDFAAFCDAMERTRGRGIKICAHVILGLPGESRDDMMDTARAVTDLGLDGIKIHHLYITRNASMADEFAAGRVNTLSEIEYPLLVCDFLECLSPDIVVQRLMSDATSDDGLIAPKWTLTKPEMLAAIANEFKQRGTRQGQSDLAI